MKILVTGGAGYIGSRLVEKLLSKKLNVTVIDNLTYKTQSLTKFCNNLSFSFIYGDIRDANLLKNIIPKFDIIFHLAALVGAPICDRFSRNAYEINLHAVGKLLKNITNQQGIIFPTTNSGYGTKSNDIYCDENSPLDPISIYGQTKVQAERLLLLERRAVALRLATVFGPSYRTRFDLLLNNFVFLGVKQNKIKLFEPNFYRNFIHIDDAVDGLIFSMENYENMHGQAFNLGSNSSNITKLKLAELVKEHVSDLEISFDNPLNDPDKRNYIVSNQKINNLGFEAKISLMHGIKEMVNVVNCTSRFDTNLNSYNKLILSN